MDRRPLFAALALIAAILAIWLLRPAAPGAPPAAEAPAPPPAAVLPREAPPLEQLPAPRGWAELSCPLPVTVTRWERIEVLVEDDGGEPIATAADLGPDLLRFRGPVPDGVGLVTLPGFEQAGVVWFTDAQGEVDCLFPRDPEPLPHGVLRLPAPGDQATFDSVFYQVCGAGLNHGEPGEAWVERELPTGPCEVTGCRQTGMFTRCAPPTEVVVLADQVVTVEPELPEAPARAMGLDWVDLMGAQWEEHRSAIAVARVAPGEEPDLPLRTGDRVLAVDDQSTRGMSLHDFLTLLETASELEVASQGGEPTVVPLD